MILHHNVQVKRLSNYLFQNNNNNNCNLISLRNAFAANYFFYPEIPSENLQAINVRVVEGNKN
jgi:hypothetical protein